ncbi:MAG TPA: hypothetical protein VFI96_02785 [Longimicrobiaceae bacterium]|nr:hypothetical protein [Longimicrobiaceae bacterium]
MDQPTEVAPEVQTRRAPAELTLRAHEPTPADLEVVDVPRKKRVSRAFMYLIGFWILMPIVAFIPPHIPWIVLAFFFGIYFFWKNWTGEYIVYHFDGRCPRCGHELTIEPGTKLKFPHTMNCPECHFDPVLRLKKGAG